MTWALIVSWLKRAAVWCAQHPAVTTILALAGMLGIEGARLASQKRKTARAQARAETAEVEGQVAVIEAHKEPVRQEIAAAETAERQAQAERDKAKVESDDEVERRRKAAARWEK